ncbi:MAG: hypothetical protein U0269_31385 [Polyangiales bacterium]
MRSHALFSCAAVLSLAASACSNNDIRVVFSSRRGFVAGASTEVAASSVPARIAVLPPGDAAPVVATVQQNVATAPGVGVGPNVLELRFAPRAEYPMDPQSLVQYPITTARTVRVGGNYWARPETVAMASDARLTLSVTTTSPIAEKDDFSWISLRSYFYRSVRFDSTAMTQMGLPAVGATSTSGWTIGASDLALPYGDDASGLPAAASNDDLMLLHSRTTKLARNTPEFDPWNVAKFTRVIGVLPVTGASFDNRGANLVAGMMVAPQMAPITVDFRATSFAALRDGEVVDARTVMDATLSMSQEAGNGPGYFTSVAVPNWSLSATTGGRPANPTCYPNENRECPDPSCNGRCDRTVVDVRDPGDLSYTFDAPRVHTSGMRDVISASVRLTRAWFEPMGDRSAYIMATSSITRLWSAQGAPLQLSINPVRNIMVGDGPPLNWTEVSAVGDAPRVQFDAPEGTAPEYYVVSVLEVFPAVASADEYRFPSVVARVYTRERSLRVPSGVLRAGSLYFLRVAAVRDGRDFAQPYVSMSDEIQSTEVFTPVFKR